MPALETRTERRSNASVNAWSIKMLSRPGSLVGVRKPTCRVDREPGGPDRGRATITPQRVLSSRWVRYLSTSALPPVRGRESSALVHAAAHLPMGELDTQEASDSRYDLELRLRPAARPRDFFGETPTRLRLWRVRKGAVC